MRCGNAGGRRTVDAWMPLKPRRDDTLIGAFVRARRWQRMLETGQVPSTRQLAEKEKINASLLARILRLTLLAPDIVETVLDGRQPNGLLLADLMKTFPAMQEIIGLHHRSRPRLISFNSKENGAKKRRNVGTARYGSQAPHMKMSMAAKWRSGQVWTLI
jgi:hypothetical protein